MKEYKYVAFGVTNQCKNSYLIPFFDYDSLDLMSIERELHTLQNAFKLSDIYVIQSSNGFNAFSFDKLDFKTLSCIYHNTKYVDKDFIKYGLERGFMTLRMGKDKNFSFIIPSNHITYIKSLSHKKFFRDIMKFPIVDENNFDNEKQITFTMFPSNKHGFDKVVFEYGYNL